MEDECKHAIATLEEWLRNLIDRKLSDAFGSNYFDAKDAVGKNIIKSQIRHDINLRMNGQNNRFPRKVDALLLDEEIDIVCNPVLYKAYFKDAFYQAYPDGNDVARSFMKQLIPIRNKLFHSNPISKHESEKVMCYSHDIIESIKNHYDEINIKKEYNVPAILYIKDSLGNLVHANQFNRLRRARPLCTENTLNKSTLYVGDILTIEVFIDETFTNSEYNVKWLYKNIASIFEIKQQDGNKFLLKIQTTHIREQFFIECIVTSNNNWHRFTSHDDMVVLVYKVLPLP